MILILIEISFAALSSLTRNISLEIAPHGLVSANLECQKILNWHKSTNAINNAVPMTVIIDILLLKRVKLLTHSFYIGLTIVSFLELLIHFFHLSKCLFKPLQLRASLGA